MPDSSYPPKHEPPAHAPLSGAKRFRRSSAALFAVMAVTLAACGNGGTAPADESAAQDDPQSADPAFYGAPTEEMVTAAQADGALTLYVSDTLSVVETLGEAFTDRFGISVEILRLTSSNLTTRFAEEAASGTSPADYLRVSDLTLYEQEPQWFVPVQDLDLPVYDEYTDFPDVFRDTYVSISSAVRAINYNKDLVAEGDVPQTWSDVLDPKWKDRLVVSNPLASSTQLGWAWAMEQANGIEFLEGLRAQEPEWVDSGVGGAQLVATGGFDLSLPVNPSHAAEVIESGAPIGHVFPTGPTVLNPDAHGIPSGAPHPDAARLWLNWRMSPEAIQLTCELVAGTTAVLPDMEGCLQVAADDAIEPPETYTDEVANPLLEALGLR